MNPCKLPEERRRSGIGTLAKTSRWRMLGPTMDLSKGRRKKKKANYRPFDDPPAEKDDDADDDDAVHPGRLKIHVNEFESLNQAACNIWPGRKY